MIVIVILLLEMLKCKQRTTLITLYHVRQQELKEDTCNSQKEVFHQWIGRTDAQAFYSKYKTT